MRLSALALLFLAVTACGISQEDYQALVEEARACRVDEACVLAGSGQCTCPTPVASSRAAEVDAAARDVRCGGAQVECATPGTPRCASGRCVGDVTQ